jgi:hypothetical protein
VTYQRRGTPRSWGERLSTRIELDANGCWVWQGPKDQKGYGRTFVGSRTDGTRKSEKTHRMAYIFWVGPIPEGLTVDHLCENKPCCNPDHLELVTSAENTRRASERRETCRRGHSRKEHAYLYEGAGRRFWVCRVCKAESRC